MNKKQALINKGRNLYPRKQNAKSKEQTQKQNEVRTWKNTMGRCDTKTQEQAQENKTEELTNICKMNLTSLGF